MMLLDCDASQHINIETILLKKKNSTIKLISFSLNLHIMSTPMLL